VFKTVTKLLEFDRKYRVVFRQVGLLDMVFKAVHRFRRAPHSPCSLPPTG
jgi:hypothetical protein